MKKLLNEVKADPFAITVYRTLDIASGGQLSLIKQSAAQIFKGFLEEKFNNLILNVLSDNLSEADILEFINSESHSNRDFISNIILKNMHADNRITTFLLAKLWVQKIRNGSLDYYESSLFTNINSLTYEDFKIFFELWKNKELTNQGYFQYTINENRDYYIDAQNKLFNLGILEQPRVGSNFGPLTKPERHMKIFDGTGFSDYLFQLLKEFFDKDINQ